jgi:predicted ester cyclase
MEIVLKEGLLLKKGHFIRSWKPRWHVLSENSLQYFETQTKEIKKGEVLIDRTTSVVAEGEFCFSIRTGEQVLDITASNEAERSAWMAAIRATASRNLTRLLYRDCLTANLYTTISETLNQLLASGYVSYGPVLRSREGLTLHIQQLWRVVPDLRWEVQQILVEGDKVVVRSLASGSPRGDFMGLVGLDGSKSFHITTIDIHSIEGGRIRSTHHLEDWGTAIRQLQTIGYPPHYDNVHDSSSFPVEISFDVR